MDGKEVELVFKEVTELCHNTLLSKQHEYTTERNRLQNFYDASKFLDIPPEQALLFFLTKHLISLKDIVLNQRNELYEQLIKEKIVDIINYLILLVCIIKEKR